MRPEVARKQFFSLHNFKYIRLLHNCAHRNLNETHKFHINITESGSSVPRRSSFSDARQLFDELPQWDVISVTTLISRLARQHRYDETFYVFSRMLDLDIRPNEYTLAAIIHASTALKNLSLGKQIHGYAAKTSFGSNVFVGSAVLDLYAKISTIEETKRVFEDIHDPNVISYTALLCGYIKKERFEDARRIFRMMPERNVVSWNAMIGGYSQKGHNEEAVNLFIEMLRQGLIPTQQTFPCVFSSAGNIASLGMGKSFHASALKILTNFGIFVANSLITFYAKCGNMEDSLLVFRKLHERNIVSWNALIHGYAQNGRGKEAISFYHHMQETDLKPNSVTILGVLLACNHGGLVDEGYTYFKDARNENPSLVKPEHYACIVDLLSRSGRFLEAEKFIQDLPFDPGIGFWKALLGGCQIHSNMELGEFVAKKILSLDPTDVSSYVMLSNAHSAAGRWQNVSKIRQDMKDKMMKRVPGCSWIEIGGYIHVFVSGYRRTHQIDEIHVILRCFLDHVVANAPNSSSF